ncbi:NipSnap2 [Plectosphaerella cucumerina]|uniref:NipSnap2 n=1 Tax=Plectosphaerella cucumerina TaxID=40658 RepID=A0A8K0TRV1_9PEZI|nr:NipSnap2 [Plectosphaerella cucumerina]
MLSQRLVKAATGAAVSRTALRTFTTTTTQLGRTPGMSDISATSQSVEAFNKRQREFREHLVEEQKKREASALAQKQSPSPSPAESPEDARKLGSLATDKKAEVEQPPRKAGPLTNLIYGTKEGRELDAQLEASFSQVLARGKYVHTISFHEVKLDKLEEYVELISSWYPKMASMPENKVHLVGSWRTEVGDTNTFVHIWEYQRYQGYHDSIHNIAGLPEFADFDRKLRSMIHSRKVSLMQEFSFWPTTPPRKLGGIFELRSYTLHPGNLLEWETHWRRGLKARREVMEGVGAWFVQIGDLNTVHHLWQFANLEERKIRREQSWHIEGWSETVHKTVPLIQEMKSRIMVPMPWSPVA